MLAEYVICVLAMGVLSLFVVDAVTVVIMIVVELPQGHND